jgi:hypothetical protein
MRVTGWFALLFMATLVAPLQGFAAKNVVIYRCTDAFGALTVQNDAACPKGSRQQKQVIQSPPPLPAYRPVAPPTPRAPAAAHATLAAPPATPSIAIAPPPPIADSDRLPPPPLFQCNTYDNDSYLSENATPEPRCVRLQTTDLQGSDSNAGVACQMVTDQCQRIADGAACAGWKHRLHETEAAWKFARAEDADADKVGFDRVQKIVRESTCGK